MKRIIWLLLSLLLLLAACASGADEFAPGEVAEPGAAAEPTATEATTKPATSDAATPAGTTAAADDPTLARERDWKLGDLTDPAVTIIEYGDFQ